MSFEIDFEKKTITGYNSKINDSEKPIVIFFEEDEDGTLQPSYYESKKYVMNIGAKISVEVVSNGFFLKKGSVSYIASSFYDLESSIKKLLRHEEPITDKFSYDDWNGTYYESDLKDAIDNMQAGKMIHES